MSIKNTSEKCHTRAKAKLINVFLGHTKHVEKP
jgi:hypothetical protein